MLLADSPIDYQSKFFSCEVCNQSKKKMKYKTICKQIPLLQFLLVTFSNKVTGVNFTCNVLVKDIQQCNESINHFVAPKTRLPNDYVLIDYSYGRSCLKTLSKYKFYNTLNDQMVIYLQFDRSVVSLEIQYSSLKAKSTGMWNLSAGADIAKWSTRSKDAEIMKTNKMVSTLRHSELEYG